MEEPSAVENSLADSLAEELERPEAVKADHWKNIGDAERGAFPHAFMQLFLTRKVINTLYKVTRKIQKEIKVLVQAVFRATSHEADLRLGERAYCSLW
jgi:transposase-like protein